MSSLLADIYNYRAVTPELASSGQPTEAQLGSIAVAGFQVIINLALHDDPRYSLPDETKAVQSLGLEYIHIPVQFAAPTTQDLQLFFSAMDRVSDKKVWVHCAANMRVTAFLGLYFAVRGGWDQSRAFALMNDVWKPNEVWSRFIAAQLDAA